MSPVPERIRNLGRIRFSRSVPLLNIFHRSRDREKVQDIIRMVIINATRNTANVGNKRRFLISLKAHRGEFFCRDLGAWVEEVVFDLFVVEVAKFEVAALEMECGPVLAVVFGDSVGVGNGVGAGVGVGGGRIATGIPGWIVVPGIPVPPSVQLDVAQATTDKLARRTAR